MRHSSALSFASFSTQVPLTDQGALMRTEAEPAQSPGRRWPEACERHAPGAEHAGTCPLTCTPMSCGVGASITPPTERHALPRIREALALGPGQKLHALSSSCPACPREDLHPPFPCCQMASVSALTSHNRSSWVELQDSAEVCLAAQSARSVGQRAHVALLFPSQQVSSLAAPSAARSLFWKNITSRKHF